MTNSESPHSVLYLPPLDHESISHYLGRWLRQEVVGTTAFQLGKKLRLGVTFTRWQKFYLNPPPNQKQLEKFSQLAGLDVDRLRLMFPPTEEPIKLKPIHLCGACYAEIPCHHMEWQFKSTLGCERHKLRLLAKCPSCDQFFDIPAHWRVGECKRCGMPFPTMAKYQNPF